jgi:hypothetical protein
MVSSELMVFWRGIGIPSEIKLFVPLTYSRGYRSRVGLVTSGRATRTQEIVVPCCSRADRWKSLAVDAPSCDVACLSGLGPAEASGGG